MTVTESFGTRGKVKTLKLKEQSQSVKAPKPEATSIQRKKKEAKAVSDFRPCRL